MAQDKWIYEFSQFQLHPAEHRLLYEGKPVAITEKVFEVLLILARNCGHLVDKSTLVCEVWGETFVEEGSLAVAISTLRKILKDDRNEPKYIETVAKHGYRFLPKVCKIPYGSAAKEIGLDEQNPLEHTIPTSGFREVMSLAKNRFQVFALIGLIAILVTLVVSLYRPSNLHASISVPSMYSVAVLPFEIQNPQPSLVKHGTELAEDLIARLAATNRMLVRPMGSVMKYAGKVSDPASIARDEHVDALLLGNFTESQGQISGSVRLVSSKGTILWSGSFAGPITQLNGVEDQISEHVLQSIYPDRGQSEQPKQLTQNSEAYELYIEGCYFWNKRTEDGFRRSIEYFQQAVLKDPRFAEAYAGLADSYTLLASYGVEPEQEAYPNAKAAALRALQLDDSLAEAHTSLGMVALYYEWNWEKADSEFRRAIELDPSYPLAHTWDALYFAAIGQPSDAVVQASRGQELDPVSLMANTELGRAYYWSRDYQNSVASLRHALELDPFFSRAHTRLGIVLSAQRDYSGAIREFQEASKLSGPDPYLDGLTGYAVASQGDSKLARRMLSDLVNRSQTQYVPAFSVALICIGLGDREQAMRWLEKAYVDRSTYLVYARVDPLLDPVRSDPKFIALLNRMGLDKNHVGGAHTSEIEPNNQSSLGLALKINNLEER